MFFLLPGELPLDAVFGWVVAQLRLEGFHDFVGVVALEHIGSEGHRSVEVLALDRVVGRGSARGGDGGDGHLLDLAIGLAAEDDLLVHQGVRIVPVGVGKTEVDWVVVFPILVAADLPAEEGAPQGESDLLGAQPIAAGLVAVDGDGHLRLGLLDVQFEAFNAVDACVFDEALHAVGVGQGGFVFGAGDLDVDRQPLGRSIGVLGGANDGVRVALDLLADGVEDVGGPEAFAVLELDKADRDAAFVRCGAELGPFGWVGGAFAHLGDHGVGQELLLLPVGIGPEEFGPVDGGHDHLLDLLGDAVGLLDVGADGHVDVDIDVLRLVLGEELHLRWEEAEQDQRAEKQTDHAVEEKPRLGAAQGKPEHALIHVFQGRE